MIAADRVTGSSPTTLVLYTTSLFSVFLAWELRSYSPMFPCLPVKLTLFCSLALLILILMAQLSCVAGCNRTFTENRQLSRHKKFCLHVQRLRQTSKDARRASGHMHDLLSHLPKPSDRRHRLQVLSRDYLSHIILI